MIDIIYLGNSAGCKTCYNKGCACSQVGSGNGCAHKLAYALDNCHTALNGNICAHSPEFVHVSETVVEYLIGNDAGTLRQTKKCGYLGLHICGETGVRHSLYAGLYKRSVNGDPNAVVIFLNVNAYLCKLCGDRFKVLGDNILYKHISSCCGSCHHICSCLDLVGDNCVGSALESFNSSYLDNICSCAHDICAHGIEEVCKVNDMRLLSCIFDNCKTCCLNGCQHCVDGSAYGYLIEIDLRTDELIGTDIYHAVIESAGSAQ